MKQHNLKASEATLAQIRQTQIGMKQAILAIEMNMGESAVSKLERKKLRDTNIDKLTRYIGALGGNVTIEIELPDGTRLVIE